MSDFSICYHHDQALKLLNKLRNVNDSDKLVDMINEVVDNIKVAKRSGKRMESRLRKYRESIESLGFKRTKKGK